MSSHFSQEPFEGTFHIEDADLQKMAKVLNDVNIKECPYFDLSDKYGNSARYYRENQWIPVSERLPEPRIDVWCNSDLGQTVGYYDETCDMWFKNDYTELIVTAWMPLPEPWKEDEE